MEICNLCAEYGTSCNGNSLDFGETSACTKYKSKTNNVPSKKKTLNPNRDLGCNNSIKREHLDLWKEDLPSYINNNPAIELIQRIINKVEHKLNHCENFIDSNKNDLKLSYYADGYYNGRARAFEEVIDIIKDTLEKATEKE